MRWFCPGGQLSASMLHPASRTQWRKPDVDSLWAPSGFRLSPAAILFDLLNGGDKNWKENPYGGLGRRALKNAGTDFELGTAGAGTGATTANLKGGLGSAFSGARERNHGRGAGRGKPGRLGHHSRKLQVLGSPV